jgi:type VI protein secretion system component VasF
MRPKDPRKKIILILDDRPTERKLIEETLADRSEQASDRLTVFYTCLGLGFTGWYNGQPEYLRKKMMEVAARLRGKGLDADAGTKLCPDAYENINTANLIEPPGRSLVGIAIALVALLIVLFVTNVQLYRSSAGELQTSLRDVSTKLRAGGQP